MAFPIFQITVRNGPADPPNPNSDWLPSWGLAGLIVQTRAQMVRMVRRVSLEPPKLPPQTP